MQTKGIRAIAGDKSVLEGISTVATLFKTGNLLVVEEEVDIFKQEVYNYVWANGKDEPVKMYDDVLDSLRYGIYTDMKKTGSLFDRNKYGI